MMLTAILLLSAPNPAHAQEGSSAFDDIDISLDDIDLGGGSTNADGDSVSSQTYSGGVTEKRNGVVREDGAPTPIAVTHSGGTVSVRCQDTEDITARIDYVIEGTELSQIVALGDGIGLSAWGNSSSAGVKTRIPYQGSSVTSAQIPLVVSVPRKVALTITSNGGWIEVLNCEGTVRATAKKDGAFVSGSYTMFDVSSATGDVKVKLDSSSEISANSKASAPQGDVTVTLPMASNVRITATGESVDVLHTVVGSVSTTSVSGDIGAGGPSLQLKASGKVAVEAP